MSEGTIKNNRRRLLTRILAAPILLLALYAAVPRSPYAFLNSFHPRRVDVDLHRLLIPVMSPPPSGSRVTLLVFRYEDAPKILTSIREQLTQARGFRASRWNDVSNRYGAEAICEFGKGTPPSAPSIDPPDDGLLFASGMGAEAIRSAYETRAGKPSAYKAGQPACIVIISERPTWFDKTIGRLLHFTRQ